VRQFAIIAMIIALLPASAYAQQRALTARTDSEQKHDAAVDKDYQDTLKRMKAQGQSTKADPWQTVRPSPAADNSPKR
jgi:hypothetical protein